MVDFSVFVGPRYCRSMTVYLDALLVSDSAQTWADLGFALNDQSQVVVGGTAIEFVPSPAKGIVGWRLRSSTVELPSSIDGIGVTRVEAEGNGAGTQSAQRTVHPNGVSAIDHLVIMTPDLERTVAALEAAGMPCRRRRDAGAYGQAQMRQAFFWLGDPATPEKVVLEVVGPAEPKDDAGSQPAAFFGLTLVCDDLASTAKFIGEHMKPPVKAVQEGRQIATLSSKAGASVALAFMSPHVPVADILLVDRLDRIATVTFNRPMQRNALSSALIDKLRRTMAELDADDDVDVIILTGADPAFCAGLDLKELGSAGTGLSQVVDPPEGNTQLVRPWIPTSKPVIGAVNGVAITGGFEIALLCDFLVASERAAFGDTHTRVGILPGWGLSVLLPQAIGLRRAIEMSVTGNFIGAEEAHRLGLVNHVVAHDELMPFARKLAADIVGNSQPSVRELLTSYRAIHRMTVADGEVHERAVSQRWKRQTFTPEAVAERRSAIMQRGRTQA